MLLNNCILHSLGTDVIMAAIESADRISFRMTEVFQFRNGVKIETGGGLSTSFCYRKVPEPPPTSGADGILERTP